MKKKYTVEDLFEVASGSTPSTNVESYWSANGNGIKWITPKDLSKLEGSYILDTERKITQDGLNSCSARLIPKGSIILSSRAPIGYVAVMNDEMACNQGCKALIPRKSKELDPLYFYYLFLTKEKELNNLGSGSTFKELSKTKLEEFQIEIHDLKTQQEIAYVLEQADKARQQRKAANALTDQFLQSSFLSLFGDPVKNEKGWKVKTLEAVCDKITDGTHHSPENLEEGDYKYITAKNIKEEGILLDNISYVKAEAHKAIYSRCNPEFEDVLYIKDGVTTGIAVVNHLKEEFSMLSSVALLKCDRKILSPYFLAAYLNNQSVYEGIRKNMGGAAITRLTLQKINAIKLILPPLSLQQQFAGIVAQTEQLRQKQRESERELENLFQALLQKYFR